MTLAQLVEHRTGIAEVMGSNPSNTFITFNGCQQIPEVQIPH